MRSKGHLARLTRIDSKRRFSSAPLYHSLIEKKQPQAFQKSVIDLPRPGPYERPGNINSGVFKRKKTIARSVRLDESMVKAAEKRAKEDRAKTGGTFNGLVELLIWQYLDRPGDFIERI